MLLLSRSLCSSEGRLGDVEDDPWFGDVCLPSLGARCGLAASKRGVVVHCHLTSPFSRT